jgi:hypothetical protein
VERKREYGIFFGTWENLIKNAFSANCLARNMKVKEGAVFKV